MRNVFDQYNQPENRLTHALVCTLSKDRRLICPFLKWLKIGSIPPLKGLRIVEQQVPGIVVSGEEIDAKGLPDACIFDAEGWALLFESKVQTSISRDQLDRHLKTAAHHGYENANIVLIAVNQPGGVLPDRAKSVEWREVYRWFRKHAVRSAWARTFVEYMQILESQMIAKEYLKQGMLTMFDGLCFDADKGWTIHGRKSNDEPKPRFLGVDAEGKVTLVAEPGDRAYWKLTRKGDGHSFNATIQTSGGKFDGWYLGFSEKQVQIVKGQLKYDAYRATLSEKPGPRTNLSVFVDGP